MKSTRTNIYLAITEAVVPPDLPDLSAAERERVVSDTSEFLAGQIAALPFRLLVLFRIGMIGFRVANRLRFLRSYCALPLATRAAVARTCAWGRVAPARHFFRAVRSIALLAYFEHPLVSQKMTARPAPSAGTRN